MPLSVGDRLSRYEIRGFLGAGGMGEVYRALDTRLDREVAIKVLPQELTHDTDRLRRFEREARAAAALNHPNILDVHDLGEHQGRTFIVTELLEGDSLREVIASGAMTLHKAIEYGHQIATGLAAAHDSGITHRDLKPANLFLTKEGTVKILDFGLAKLARPKTNPAELSKSPTLTVETASGIAMGTPGYMSPEQLQGKRADHRSDVFSLGVVLYEMVAERHPFPGATTAEIHAAILKEDPVGLSHFDPEVPPLFEHLVNRCLEKEPEDRCQSARELLFALEELSSGDTSTKQPSRSTRNFRRASIVAAAVTAIVIAALVFQRPSHSVPFQERDWLLITNVENLTGEATFDNALNPALAVAIEQSSYVNVLSRDSMQPVLQQMKQADATTLDETLGREIARRRGIDVVLVPSVSKLGSRYILTASLKNAATGGTYASRFVRADSIDDVLPALDRLCREVRSDLGETFSSITERSKPLADATTSSLKALEQFSLAHARHRRSDPSAAKQHYETALRIDPDFVGAKVALATLHMDWGHMLPEADREIGKALLSEAVEEIDSLTELEQLQVLALHAQFVEQDLEHAAELYTTLLSIYPDQPEAHHNLGLIYWRLDRPDEAVQEFKTAIAVDPNLIVAYDGLVWILRARYGDVPAIIEWATREIEILDEQPWPHLNLSWAYLAQGDGPRAVAAAEKGIEIGPNLHYAAYHLGHALKISERYTEAARAFDRVLEISPNEYWAHYHAGFVLDRAGDQAGARSHYRHFKTAVETEIENKPDDLNCRLWLDFALIQLGEEPRAELSSDQLASTDPALNWNLAQLFALTGRTEEAIDRLERALSNGAENPIWILCHPNLDPLHSEPRYLELKRRTLKL